MNTKLTVLIIGATGARVRQATIPKSWFPASVLLFVGILIVIFFGISDYLRLKEESKRIHSLHFNLQTQTEQITHQKKQIAKFSHKINQLKLELADLHDFEHKIRVIANLDPQEGRTSLFGVGGSDPAQSDPMDMIQQDVQELIRDMHDDVQQIDHASSDQQKAFVSIYDQLESKRNLLAATPSIRPVEGWISSRFGRRQSPFTGRREFHRGVDIAVQSGTPIIAPADGVVTYSGRKGLMGKMITIDHGFGMVTRYGHMKELLKKSGERVKRGETIARVGNTGRSTGPHLHYEVRLNGVAVNPMNYFLN